VSGESASGGICRSVSELSIDDAYVKWADDLVRYATVLVGPDDALDLVADVFTRILAGGTERWSKVRQPDHYLIRATTNEARAHARSGARRRQREGTMFSRAAPASELLRDRDVAAAIGRLSVRQRAVLYLLYWEDMTEAGVAGVLGIAEGSVRRHAQRGRNAMKMALT
jgi:RNA polymerase sigma factor (sigma-70 family)